MLYHNRLQRLIDPPPLLADHPEFVEPLSCDDRYLAPPVDATLATFPASTTPRFTTQTALANAALQHLITQVGWVTLQS